MNHKWKKRQFHRETTYDGGNGRGVRLTHTKECTQCGLRKGYTREYGYFPRQVYCDSEKVLSTSKIPFSCNFEWIGGELPINSNRIEDFICEDEFKV